MWQLYHIYKYKDYNGNLYRNKIPTRNDFYYDLKDFIFDIAKRINKIVDDDRPYLSHLFNDYYTSLRINVFKSDKEYKIMVGIHYDYPPKCFYDCVSFETQHLFYIKKQVIIINKIEIPLTKNEIHTFNNFISEIDNHLYLSTS